MTGPHEDPADFLALLQAADDSAWSEGGDLSRLSIDSFGAREGFERSRSTGVLRLSGEGVRGHAARLDVIGLICQEFQRLVVAVGAAQEGVRSARGKISESLQRRIRLHLQASPAPGSLVLHLTPELDPNEEVSPGGQTLIDPPVPLADRSVDRVVEILQYAVRADAAAEQLETVLHEVGPRAASALSLLAKALDEDELDFDLAWMQPRQSTRRARLTTEEARWLRIFVSQRRLDESLVVFEGVLRTVSDRRALELQIGDDEIVYLKRGDETPALLGGLLVGDRVRVGASEKVEAKVGGGEARSHALIWIERLDQ
jgi:hypothetical protein